MFPGSQSPWSGACTSSGRRGGEYPGWCRWVGTGGGYTGYYHPPTPDTRLLVLPGPNQSHIQLFLRPLGTPGPCWALRTPSSSHSVSWLQGRDSIINILKLVKTAKCRPKSDMRPAILPISKRGSISHDLEFSDFRFSQPSLARNKWSRFEARGYFMVKTAKCHQMYTTSDTRSGRHTPAVDAASCLLSRLLMAQRAGTWPVDQPGL